MLKDKMSRRGFLSSALAGISIIALSFFGCGKKKEEPGGEPEPEKPAMTEEEKKEYVFTNCICKKCPSWVECDEKGGFCLAGKSSCIKEKKGCICRDCPVTKKLGLKYGYYCLSGSAAEQMKAETM